MAGGVMLSTGPLVPFARSFVLYQMLSTNEPVSMHVVTRAWNGQPWGHEVKGQGHTGRTGLETGGGIIRDPLGRVAFLVANRT